VLLPLVAGQLGPLELVPGLAQLCQGLVDALVLALGLEQGVELLLKSLLGLTQTGQAGPGGEQQLAQAALACSDLFAGAVQAGVVDTEEGREGVLVQPAQEPFEPPGHDRGRIVGLAERVLVPFAAEDLQDLAIAVPQLGTDAELAVRMDEVVGRLGREAKEQVRQGA
jgi:hypothetical protein